MQLSETSRGAKELTMFTVMAFRNWIFIGFCVISISLDPLFFFIPVINDDQKCITFNKELGIVAIVLRSLLDFFHIFSIIFTTLEYRRRHSSRLVISARKYFMYCFPIDIVSVLPLPQVVVFIIITGSKLPNAMKLLKYFVLFQSAPRIIRIFPLFMKAKRNSSTLTEATWIKAALNLLLYMLASHVFGALWYFLAIDKAMICWKKACMPYTRCGGSFYCNDNFGDNKFLNDFCSTKTQNAELYDFGIFYDALHTGIVEVTNVPQKFLHCFRWGLQNLSCFGQNLQTSSSMGENFFAIWITISGLVLFLFLIGNMQVYLQSKTVRSEEMRLKVREIEQWTPFRKLSVNLQQQVKKYQRYVWRETKGVNVENLLNNFPKDLRRSIMRELCLDLLKKVPLFEKLDEYVLEAISDRLKPVLYTEESYIVREADPIDEMLFVTRGKLLGMITINGSYRTFCLDDGDLIGTELINWALMHPHRKSLPASTITVRTVTEVEAFALVADDLKFVIASQFNLHDNKQFRHTYRFYSIEWRTWAACYIQAAWRHYQRKLLVSHLAEEESSLQRGLGNANGISSNLGSTIYATRFAANALCAIRHNDKAKRVPTILLQKPAEPDFVSKEQ